MSSMVWFRKFAMKTLLGLRHRKSRNVIRKIIAQLRASEKLSDESLRKLQVERLSQLLLHAYHHVPYYQNVLQTSGVVNADMQVDISRFHQVPLLDKSTIHAQWDALKSDDLASRQWYFNASGGSTGEQVRLIQDKKYRESTWAVRTIFDKWSGLLDGEGKIRLWGSKRDLLVDRESIKTKLLRWLNNELWLNAYHMTEQQMKEYVERINTFKPVQILAYPESIYEISLFIERQGLEIYSPKAIVTSGGTLFPYMREGIEHVFATKVFNRYGSREVGAIACECEQHEGLHVSALTNYVEILHPDGTPTVAGEVGEIVVTSLINYAMPLIRYRIGDLATWSQKPCGCGCVWPLIQEITGRVSDTFITHDGTQVNGKYFHHLFYFRDWIRRFQVIQENIDYVRVLIALSNIDTQKIDRADELEEIRKMIQTILGSRCRVEFEFIMDIPPTASGKYRYTISKVSASRKPIENNTLM